MLEKMDTVDVKHQPDQREVDWFNADSTNPESKIFSCRDDLLNTVETIKNLGGKIVLTSGTFDILHIGHARYLEKASAHGDFLIVGVDSDEKVKARKGPDRPVVPESERIVMLSHLQSVDAITVKQDNEPRWDLIKQVRPDTLIVTKETYDEVTLKQLDEFCGQVVCLEPQATTSTTAKIRLLQVDAHKKVVEPLRELMDRYENDRRALDDDFKKQFAKIAFGGLYNGQEG